MTPPAQSEIAAASTSSSRRPARRAAPAGRRIAARPDRLDSRNRRRSRPLAQRHGHQLHPATAGRRGQLQLSPERTRPHPGRRHHLCRARRAPDRNRRIPGPGPHGPPRPLHHHGRRRVGRRHRLPFRPAGRRSQRSFAAHSDRPQRRRSRTPFRSGPSPWNAAQITVLHADSPLVPRFELWADADTASETFRSAPKRRRRTLRSAKPRMAADPRRNPALRHRHPRPRTAPGDRHKPAPCTSPKAATSARRSSSASAPAAMSIAPSARSASTANYPPPAHPSKLTASRSASSPPSLRFRCPPQTAQPCSSALATSAARPSTEALPFSTPAESPSPCRFPFPPPHHRPRSLHLNLLKECNHARAKQTLRCHRSPQVHHGRRTAPRRRSFPGKRRARIRPRRNPSRSRTTPEPPTAAAAASEARIGARTAASPYRGRERSGPPRLRDDRRPARHRDSLRQPRHGSSTRDEL